MWWSALTLLQKIYFCIATPATVILILQIILMIIGFGGGEADFDADVDADVDVDVDVDADGGFEPDIGFRLFTIRGLIAFLTIGGWVGFTFGDGNKAVAIILSLACGLAALVGMAFLLKWLLGLQSNGNISYAAAVGKTAEVYLTIPANNGGSGKVNLILNESLTELTAKTNAQQPIKTGSKVKVVGVENDILIVEPIE